MENDMKPCDEEKMEYDEDILKILRERSERYLSGKEAIYTLEESMELIKKYRLESEL